jgi:sugar lactone lactonase YvrE
MYIIELETGRLHRRLPSGTMQVLRETHPKGFAGDGGPVSEAQFNGPHNCVVTADNRLLIADSWNHCVRSVDLKTMRVETIAGTGESGYSGDGGPASEAHFDYVMCIALDPSKRTLHIADLRNRRARDVDLVSGRVKTIAGTGEKAEPDEGAPANESPLIDPRAVASDANGNLYILERNANCLRMVRPDGTLYTVAGTGERGWRDGEAKRAGFGAPKHICCDPAGNVYIADDANGAIRKYDPRKEVVTTLLGRGFGDKRITLKKPHGVRWHEGHLFVVDTGNNRIMRIKTDP